MFGRVISGGKPMTKGLTKGINDKREKFMAEYSRREVLSDAVKKAIYKGSLSEPKLNDVNTSAKKKFTTPTKPSKV